MSVSPALVYTGSWTNWDGGRISGGTITLPQRSAQILDTFSGLFIAFTESAFWALVAYLIFQIQSSSTKTLDALHLQKQVALRNSGTDAATAWSMASLAWVWRHQDIRANRRTIVIAVLAVINFLFFVVAMPFLWTQISESTAGEVLVRSPYCGYWSESAILEQVPAGKLYSNRTWQALNYVENCYNSNLSSTLCDNNLVSRQLRLNKNWEAGCPFDSELCIKGTYGGFGMRTGLIDSHADLGINAPNDDRMFIERQTVCAPLNWTQYVGNLTGASDLDAYQAFYFGPATIQDPNANYTYTVSLFASLSESGYVLKSASAYTLDGQVDNLTSSFQPIPGLRRSDGDVTLVFLANNGVAFTSECEDPFFSATTSFGGAGHPDFYIRDHPATVIGCVDQYRLYDRVSNIYTNYSSLFDLEKSIIANKDAWRLSHGQLAAMQTMYWALSGQPGIGRVIELLGAQALRAQKEVFAGFSGPLPADQWMDEVSHWFNIGLAHFQQMVVEIATGPPDPSLEGLTNNLPELDFGAPSRTNYTKLICSAQKVKSPVFANYNLSGFVAFVVVGVLIIFSPLLVIPASQRLLVQDANRLAWIEDGDQQLLRLAHEAAGCGDWDHADREIPTPAGGDATAVGLLNLTNPQHPTITPRRATGPAATPAVTTATQQRSQLPVTSQAPAAQTTSSAGARTSARTASSP